MKNLFSNLLYNKNISSILNYYYELKLKNLKSLIFVATTGRSGTLTLVDIFNQLENCTALHEPYPSMHDNILQAAAYEKHEIVETFYKTRKSVNIRRDAMGAEYYLEANHLFIKTFIQHAIDDFGKRVKIIHLTRDPTRVANSIYTLQDQPGTMEGDRWWLDYRAPTNHIAIADILDNHTEFKHPYYKALWYWFEIETRISDWKLKLPETPFIFFQTEDFNDEQKLSHLFQSLNIRIPKNFVKKIVNLKSHARTHQKKIPPLSDKKTQLMLHQFIALLENNNISIPETMNLYK